MKKLLLTSGGMQVVDEILKLLPKSPNLIKIAHITTATNVFAYAPWMKKDKMKMLEFGFQVEDIDIKGKTKKQLNKKLKGKDIIYVQGGDPYYLLKQVKQSGFDEVVKKLISKGVIYIGASAGSYIACPTIEMALWKKPKRPRYGLKTDEAAMNLVPFLISVHYEPKYKKVIKKCASGTNYPVKILTDYQAILIKNGKAQLVGKGKEIKL